MKTISRNPFHGALAWVAALLVTLSIACGSSIEVSRSDGATSAGGGAASTTTSITTASTMTATTTAFSSTATSTTPASSSVAASTTGSGAGGATTSSSPSARFANLAPARAPFDVCTSAAGKPLLAPLGLTGGLRFGDVSRYLDAGSEGSTWRIVAPGASCSDAAAVPLPIVWPAGADKAGARVTVVVSPITATAGAISVDAYLDEPINNQYGINLRLLDYLMIGGSASASLPMVREQSAGEPDPKIVFSNLAFATLPSASPLGAVTAGGFLHVPYTAVGKLDIQPDTYVNSLVTTTTVPVPAGDGNAYGVASIFVAGIVFPGSVSDGAPRVVVCADNAPPQGALSSCTVLMLQPT